MADDDFSAEIWRDIPGFDDYEASSLGRVRTKPKILKPWFNKQSGYLQIGLGRRFKGPVHRVVCLAFHGAPPDEEKRLVAHGDGDRLNNKSDNLRWASHRENMMDAIAHGTTPLAQYRGISPKRERHHQAKLTEADVAEILRLGATTIKRQEIAKRFGVDRNQIWRILTGRNWRR